MDILNWSTAILAVPLTVLFWKMPSILMTWKTRPRTPKQKKPKTLSETDWMRNYLRERDQTLEELLHLVISKDPQTFSALRTTANQGTYSTPEYMPTQGDIAEWNRYAVATGQAPIDPSEFIGESDGTGGRIP